MAVTAAERGSTDLCYDVVRAVADCHGEDPTEIDAQLVDVVDPDALSSIWSAARTDPNGTLSFEFYDCRVTVQSDGFVEAERL